MSENLYEGLFLLDSARFAADPDGTSQVVLNMLEKAGGTVVANLPWQDGKLAFPIEGHRKGLHYLAYFKMGGDGVSDVSRACKLSDVVLRQLIIKHPEALFDAMVGALGGGEEAAAEEEEAAAAEAKSKADAGDDASEGDDDDSDD